jgi:bifunctional enzyme CysN/CysC
MSQSMDISAMTPFPLVVVGHVDHGKSSLMGRLLYETGRVPENKIKNIQAMCDKRGMPFEYSFLLDALQLERDQAITVDTSRIWFQTPLRRYVMIDAPGHIEFLRNMMTGASGSEAALMVIDAEQGIQEQTKRHGYLLQLLGVKQLIVIINKMDLLDYNQAVFAARKDEYQRFLQSLSLEALAYIPVSARYGDCIKSHSNNMPWYKGLSLLEQLDQLRFVDMDSETPLRLPIQDIYKFDHRRVMVGRLLSGRLEVGDLLCVSPSNKQIEVASIESWPLDVPIKTAAYSGESVAFTSVQPVLIERGDVLSHLSSPPHIISQCRIRIAWLGEESLQVGMRYIIRFHTMEMEALVQKIHHRICQNQLIAVAADQINAGDIAEISLKISGLAVVDAHTTLPKMGRMVICDRQTHIALGAAIILAEDLHDLRVSTLAARARHIQLEDYSISEVDRCRQNGHRSGVLWLSGLSGSGKSTLARELQQRLFYKGCQVFVLDGDNMRAGLCADLGFSPAERSENIRRVGEVAALFAQAGMIVITAFISPYAADRQRARQAYSHHFHEIYIQADIDICVKRDPKGLYAKAKRGEINDFTGVSAPFEEPVSPDLVIRTDQCDVDECIETLLDYVDLHFIKSK